MEMENDVTISFSMDAFTLGDQRETHIRLTHGEIDGDERILRVRPIPGRGRAGLRLLRHTRQAVPRRSRPKSGRGFRRHDQPQGAPLPHINRKIGRKPPDMLRSRAKQAIRTDRNSRPNALIAPGTNKQAATERLQPACLSASFDRQLPVDPVGHVAAETARIGQGSRRSAPPVHRLHVEQQSVEQMLPEGGNHPRRPVAVGGALHLAGRPTA